MIGEEDIDWEIMKVVERKFPGISAELKYFRITKVVNSQTWKQAHPEFAEFGPDIDSIFVFGLGGSYAFEDQNYGEVSVTNGTLGMFLNVGKHYSQLKWGF
jgi:hypothetical protein